MINSTLKSTLVAIPTDLPSVTHLVDTQTASDTLDIQADSNATTLFVAASALALAACSSETPDTAISTANSASTASTAKTSFALSNTKPVSDAQAARFLQHAGFSSTLAEIAALKTQTYVQYLQAQFAMPLGQTGWAWLEQRGYGVNDVNHYALNAYPADFMIWNQLFTGNDTLRKRCALALSECFVVSLQGTEIAWRSHAMAAYWDVLAAGSFGNFRTLLEDITLNAAMGNYLNTKGNLKEDLAKGRLPDENYAREVMQLFTLGVYVLNPDGTEKLDASGNRIETYGAADVAGLAKVFTGYDFDTSDGVRITLVGQTNTVSSRDFARKRMVLNPAKHSLSTATFLGATVPAGTVGEAALKIALDTLFNHPNVAPFFAKQMIQRLVTSNPSPAYVARVAAKFVNNGAGVRGDLKAVWTAILTDDDALGATALTSNSFGKLREPILRLVQWGRTFWLQSVAQSWKIFDLSNSANALGQSPLRAPSVFNFFRPGYVPPSSALSKTKTPAPEFQLVSETSVSGYLNYMQAVIRKGFSSPEPTVPQAAFTNYQYDITASYAAELALVNDAAALVARLNLVLCAGRLSTTQVLMVNALNATPITSTSTAAQKLDRIAAAVLMVMGCTEYLVQK
jgi:uncharacterized protein (DUF1800 family)